MRNKYSGIFGRQIPKFTLVIGLVLQFYSVLGQYENMPLQGSDLYVNFFTIEHGLPSNEVYDIELSKDGQLWMCTDNGIARFDGHSVYTFPSDGYSSLVLGVEKSEEGELWFWTISGEILKLDERTNRIIKPFEELQNSIEILGVVTNVAITKHRIFITSGGKLYTYQFDTNTQKWSVSSLTSERNEVNVILLGEKSIIYGIGQTNEGVSLNIYDQDSLLKNYFVKQTRNVTNVLGSTRSGNMLIVQFANKICRINTSNWEINLNTINQEFTPSLYLTSDSVIWIGGKSHGIKGLNFNSLETEYSLLNELTVTAMVIGENGNRWYSTLERGIAFQTNSSIHYIKGNFDFDQARTFATTKDNLYIGTFGGKLYQLQRSGNSYTVDFINDYNFEITEINVANDTIYSMYSHFISAISKQKKELFTHVYNDLEFKKRPIFIMKYIYYLLDKNIGKYRPLDAEVNTQRIRKYFDFGNSGIYFGDFKQAQFFNPKNEQITALSPNNSVDLRAAIRVNGDSILLGTKGNGLLLAKNGQIITDYSVQDEYLSIVLKMVKIKGSIWFITPSELFKISSIKADSIVYKSWNSILGFNKLAMHNLEVWNDNLVLSTSKGLFIFNPKEVKTEGEISEILKLRVKTKNKTYLNPKEEINLPYRFTGVSIIPKSINFSHKLGIDYRYRIANVDSQWISTSTIPIAITSLPKGRHYIEIQTQNKFGDWSQQKAVVTLNILPPYWESGWFITLLLVLLGTFGVGLYWNRVRQINANSQLKIESIEASNKALSLQLNPHFVFNALNSVVATIASKDTKTAVRFLSRLSKLMRQIFEHSQYNSVSLKEELNAVEQYLELESMRLEESFHFEINIEKPLLPTQFMIPPLVIQPIAENAIWHGIVRLKEGKGVIKINLKMGIDDNIHISVFDNGPGKKEVSAASKVEKSRLSSIKLIEKRFELLNRLNNGGYQLILHTDLASGFISEIIIPKIEKKDIV